MIKLSAIILGRVQGVHYRAYVQDTATNLGLLGSIKNLSNGTVEVIAVGPPGILKEFVEHLHEGSLLAEVESVSVDWGTAIETFSEFSIVQ